ncbi:MAG: serine hydrolase domain-containing protein [Salinibacter sp.]
MMVRRPLLLVLVVLVCSAQIGAAQRAGQGDEAPTSRTYAEAIDESRALLDTLMDRETVPGLTAAVLVDGRVVWSEGFGYANLETRTPVTPLTKMRIGSVSKPLTSVALGRLVEEGRLDLDAPVQEYVPSFPEKRYEITPREVAGHIAGIRHYDGDEFYSRTHYDSVEEGLDIFERDSLLFEPGTEYDYSSYGWNLVSAVVEGAAETPFLKYMRREVIEPMHLRHTVAGHTDSLISYRTQFYTLNDEGQVLNAPYVDNSNKWAGGGYLSTASDLVRFGDAMIQESVLSSETTELLFTPLETTDGESTEYGLGWRIGTDDHGRRTVGHTGGSVGGTTRFVIYPEQHVVVALISNLGGVEFEAAEERIAHFFLQEKE